MNPYERIYVYTIKIRLVHISQHYWQLQYGIGKGSLMANSRLEMQMHKLSAYVRLNAAGPFFISLNRKVDQYQLIICSTHQRNVIILIGRRWRIFSVICQQSYDRCVAYAATICRIFSMYRRTHTYTHTRARAYTREIRSLITTLCYFSCYHRDDEWIVDRFRVWRKPLANLFDTKSSSVNMRWFAFGLAPVDWMTSAVSLLETVSHHSALLLLAFFLLSFRLNLIAYWPEVIQRLLFYAAVWVI